MRSEEGSRGDSQSCSHGQTLSLAGGVPLVPGLLSLLTRLTLGLVVGLDLVAVSGVVADCGVSGLLKLDELIARCVGSRH